MNPLLQATELASARQQAAWARRRPGWTRTDTMRWLDARSPTVLAWLRRRDPSAPVKEAAAMGLWLQRHRPVFFGRAHAKLAAPAQDAQRRDRLNVLEVLP